MANPESGMRTTLRQILLSVLFMTGLCLQIRAQQHGYHIQNFPPSAYDGYDQVWHTRQDKNGLLYFGGTSSVFCYDGQNWQTIPVKAGAACRYLHYDESNDIMYVASVGDFGYLGRHKNGSLYYQSLCTGISEKQKSFTDVWKINAANGFIYFQAAERIFVVKDKKINSVIEAPAANTFALSFTAAQKVYVRQRNVGLMEISGSRLVPVIGCERFAKVRLLGMLSEKNGSLLLLTGDNGFLRYRPATQTLDTIPCISDEFLTQSGVLGCIWANDSVIGVCSRGGIAFYSASGKLISTVDKKTGLGDETIATLFADRDKNIWANSNYGISRITFNSPVRLFNSQAGFEGSLTSIGNKDSLIFFSTTEGLYVTNDSENENMPQYFRKLTDIQTEIWEILPQGNDLLLCSTGGLLLFRHGQISHITNAYTNCLRPVTGTQNLFLAVEKGGISIIEKKSDNEYYSVTHHDLGALEIIRASPVRKTNKGQNTCEIWCSTRFKEGVHIELDLTAQTLSLTKYNKENGFDEKDYYPVFINDSVYFFHNHNVIRYLPLSDKGRNTRCFAPAPEMMEKFYGNAVLRITPPFDPGLMLEPLNNKPEIFFGEWNNSIHYHAHALSSMTDRSAINQSLLTPRHIWTASSTAIMRISYTDKQQNAGTRFRTLVRKVITGKDSLLCANIGDSNYTFAQSLPYSLRDITFHFAAPLFEINSDMIFRCKLEGFDTAWFNTEMLTFKAYTNLPEGSYTFFVQAVSASGRISDVTTFRFEILPPWYRTGWAYTLYVLLFGALILITARLSAVRLRKQKQRLESIVQSRTAEVQQQKQQLQSQKTELETAYTDIRDSIHYARRIQSAILPLESDMQKLFGSFFVLYQPQDIVSGDFYWCAEINGLKFLACVDCTGHGVPGAFMSMIGNTLLNHLVVERGLTQPHEILEQLHTGVRHALKQDSVGETKDGMDVALITINPQNVLHYAGANRALWYIRQNSFHEIKPVKRAIAGDMHATPVAFTTHTLELQTGDCIYLSTDGYADQFGGERGKKFMVKRFQELLLQIHSLPMNEQQRTLHNEFNTWKGNLQQVDDVLVMGLKI